MATNWQLDFAAHCVRVGGIIAYPTEGVWGLGCLPESQEAVRGILRMKERSWTQGLLLVAADISQFADYLSAVSPVEYEQLQADWPGPVTYLVPDNGRAPEWIRGKHPTLGLRVSAHPLVRALCERTGPLVSTSANISGRPPATRALQVRKFLGAGVDMIVSGKLGGLDGPSKIKVLKTGEVVR